MWGTGDRARAAVELLTVRNTSGKTRWGQAWYRKSNTGSQCQHNVQTDMRSSCRAAIYHRDSTNPDWFAPITPLFRSAARSRQSQIRAHQRRRKTQHSTGGTPSDRNCDHRQRCHEESDEEYEALRSSGPVRREGYGNQPVNRERLFHSSSDGRRCNTPPYSEEDPARSGGGAARTMEDVPRCLEDWRVPDISPRLSSQAMDA